MDAQESSFSSLTENVIPFTPSTCESSVTPSVKSPTVEAIEAILGFNEKQRPQRRYSFDDAKHVHSLDGIPMAGTSTVVGALSKELTWWASGMALTPLGWLNKRKSTAAEREDAAAKAILQINCMSPKQFADVLESCYRAHNTKKETAAVTGTDMHGALERYILECIYGEGNNGTPVLQDKYESAEVEIFANWSVDKVEEFLWAEGHCYSERLWCGGICDCGARLKNGKLALLDFKSSKDTFYSQFVQVGGYTVQIAENGIFTAQGARVLEPMQIEALAVFPFGMSEPKPRMTQKVSEYALAFEGALVNYKLKKDFDQ